MPRILIADDEVDLRDIVKMVLKMDHPDYEVETACSKEEIMNKTALMLPDLILLDVWLGPENGREICRFLKTCFKETSIILTSGSAANLESYEECLADDYLEKPFEMAELLKKINHLLQSSLQK